MLGGLSLFVLAGAAVVAIIALRRVAARTVMLFGIVALITGVAVTVLAVSLGSEAVFFAGSAIAGDGFGSGFQGGIRRWYRWPRGTAGGLVSLLSWCATSAWRAPVLAGSRGERRRLIPPLATMAPRWSRWPRWPCSAC